MVEAWDNLEQFLSLFPDCVPLIEEHDRQLEVLFESCRTLETRLVESDALQEAYRRLTSPANLPPAPEVREIFGTGRPEDSLKVLAEYIINDVQRLPSYYSTAAFWSEHSQEFLAIRESGEVRPLWQATVEAAGRMSAAIDRLIDILKQVRNDLSLSAGVPIVERC